MRISAELQTVVFCIVIRLIPASELPPGLAKNKSNFEKLSHDFSFKMIAIKEGTLQIGSPESESDRLPNERPTPKSTTHTILDRRTRSHLGRIREFDRNKPLGEKHARSERIRIGSSPNSNELDPEEPKIIWRMFSGGKSWVGIRVVRVVEESPELAGM